MILVTVGTQFFDELIDEVDRLAGLGTFAQPVLAQVGLSRRAPTNIDHVAFDRDLLGTAAKADLIITHAGTGSLCELIALGRPFIAVVNDTKAGNHQLEFLQRLSKIYDFCWVDSPKKLQAALGQARPARRRGSPTPIDLAGEIRSYLNSSRVRKPIQAN
jgi:UDP-N-acetylglucosamine transferase subunit ALG13